MSSSMEEEAAQVMTTSTKEEATQAWNRDAYDLRSKSEEVIERTWNEIKKGVGSTPTMVFSVIGDSDSYVSRPWPKSVFKTALIEAAMSGGETWILYRGNKMEVSKVVRDAYKNYEYLDNYKKRSNKGNKRKIKLISLIPEEEEQTFAKPKNEFNTRTDMTYSTLEFEKYVSKQQILFGMPVPIAIFVCGGDKETIDHICRAIENKIPVIIMKGSGMAADLVDDFINNSKLSSDDRCKKIKYFLSACGVDDTKLYDKIRRYLKRIKEKKGSVSVFDLDQDDPLKLSNIVGEAVLECWSIANINKSASVPDQSHLGLAQASVNRLKFFPPEHAEEMQRTLYTKARRSKNSEKLASLFGNASFEIEKFIPQFKKVNGPMPYVLNPKFTKHSSPPLYFYYGYQLLQDPKYNNKFGQVLLLEALKANRVDYVRNLLDQGVILENAYLGELYNAGFRSEEQIRILTQVSENLAEILLHESEFFFPQKLNNKSKPEKEKLPDMVMSAAMELCRKCIHYSEYFNTITGYQDGNNSSILLWSILANRKDIAEICWLRGNELILTGLVCSVLLKKLSENANNVEQAVFKSALEEHSKWFEKRCIILMDRMYEEDAEYATNVMDTDTKVWGIYCSPLDFAYENEMLNVVAHACSRRKMNRQWYKNLNHNNTLPFLQAAFTKSQNFFSAPRTKYFVHYLLFFLMLVMYSIFVLTSVSTEYYNQTKARVYEYYVYFWVAGDIVEEIITCFGGLHNQHCSKKILSRRLKMHLNNFWNLLDLVSYVLIILAFLLRHFYWDTTFTVARRMLALSLLVMYLRFLEAFLIHKKLGPTLIMIKEMLEDLFSFLFIAVFVLLGVGIYYHANIWPDDQTILSSDSTEWKIWTIFYYPYWQLFAELNLNYLEGSEQPNCNNSASLVNRDSSMSRCPQEDWTVPVVAAVYLLLSNLLLINLVIAKFSYTFERVQENSEKLWLFEWYTAVIDYSWRIPSPFNLLFLPFRFFNFRGFCKRAKVIAKEETKKIQEEIMDYQRDFQKVIAVRLSNKF